MNFIPGMPHANQTIPSSFERGVIAKNLYMYEFGAASNVAHGVGVQVTITFLSSPKHNPKNIYIYKLNK